MKLSWMNFVLLQVYKSYISWVHIWRSVHKFGLYWYEIILMKDKMNKIEASNLEDIQRTLLIYLVAAAYLWNYLANKSLKKKTFYSHNKWQRKFAYSGIWDQQMFDILAWKNDWNDWLKKIRHLIFFNQLIDQSLQLYYTNMYTKIIVC